MSIFRMIFLQFLWIISKYFWMTQEIFSVYDKSDFDNKLKKIKIFVTSRFITRFHEKWKKLAFFIHLLWYLDWLTIHPVRSISSFRTISDWSYISRFMIFLSDNKLSRRKNTNSLVNSMSTNWFIFGYTFTGS